MARLEKVLAVMLIGLLLAISQIAAAGGNQESKTQDIVGTWQLVSAKYQGSEHIFPEGSTTIKHVTPTQFMWATYDKDGSINRAAGGRYTLDKEDYTETPEYGMSASFDVIKGKAQSFKCKIEGNKWYHNGQLSNGVTIEEIWQRDEK